MWSRRWTTITLKAQRQSAPPTTCSRRCCGPGERERERERQELVYLAHPLLGVRYRESVVILQDLVGTTADAVFGSVDAKLRSSLTLLPKQ
ncbi:MAG: DUF1810 family protein [Bradyrhizobium sp.]